MLGVILGWMYHKEKKGKKWKKWFPQASTSTLVMIKFYLILFLCVVANLQREVRSVLPFFQKYILENFITIALADGSPPPPTPVFLTYRYLKLQLPCLGGCDVTSGISNVILVSRRDHSRKCLMNDEALCSDCPDVSRAARGGNRFLKSCPSISEPGGNPRVHMNHRDVTISI